MMHADDHGTHWRCDWCGAERTSKPAELGARGWRTHVRRSSPSHWQTAHLEDICGDCARAAEAAVDVERLRIRGRP